MRELPRKDGTIEEIIDGGATDPAESVLNGALSAGSESDAPPNEDLEDLEEPEQDEHEEDYTDDDPTDSDSQEEHLHDDHDLSTIIMNEIKDESYVCLVCTSEIGPYSRTWDCKLCYRVYHVSCINNWSQKGSSTDDNGNWKCPHCSGLHQKQKIQHKCWCGKVINPSKNGLTPGSCGQTCGVKLQDCPHSCTLPCHPGPHAACNALGPPMKCHCGSHETQWPCVLTPYREGWKCEDRCEEYLPCEIHKCNRVCHDGLCGRCEEFIESKCYCGATTDHVKCHLRVPLKSITEDKTENFVGNFKCSNITELFYDCGTHSDLVPCQPRSKRDPRCPLSPDVIKTCPCGQTSILELNNGENRQACTDPIPTCDKVCNKLLSCGHHCKDPCHEGACSPCYQFIKTKCSCGFNSYIVPCKFLLAGNIAKCSRKCSALLSCRRHRCNNICCPEEGISMERERERKKALRKNQVNVGNSNEAFSIEATHICLKTCEKRLSCGNPDHLCQRTCHVGPCPPCLESTNDDLICHCGQTVVFAPIRCGVTLPHCESQCIRERNCGHSQMPHNCHQDDVECPKCTKSVKKTCVCGKSKVWAMCYQNEVYCAIKCGKLLACGHHCLKACHQEGECECTSICGITKKYCSHVDRQKCHYPEPCKEAKHCKEQVTLKCKCGRRKKDALCGANSETPSVSRVPLDCDVSCVLQEREDQLRAAFGVVQPKDIETPDMMDLPYNTQTLKIAHVQLKWCTSVENILIEFMKSEKVSFIFKPMRREQREFVHLLAEAFGLHSESQDPEPRRSVYVLKRPVSKVPKYSLTQAVSVYLKNVKQTTKTLRPSSSSSSSFSTSQQKHSTQPNSLAEFNAILVEDCIEGVTRPELEESIIPLISTSMIIKTPLLKWVVEDKFLVIPGAFMRLPKAAELELKNFVQDLKVLLKTKFLANTVKLVKMNEYYRVVKEYVEEKNVEEEKVDGYELEAEAKSGRVSCEEIINEAKDMETSEELIEDEKQVNGISEGVRSLELST